MLKRLHKSRRRSGCGLVETQGTTYYVGFRIPHGNRHFFKFWGSYLEVLRLVRGRYSQPHSPGGSRDAIAGYQHAAATCRCFSAFVLHSQSGHDSRWQAVHEMPSSTLPGRFVALYRQHCNDWTENSELYCIFDAWKSRSHVAKYRNGLMTIPNRRRSFSSLQLTHRPILLGRETAIEITRTELQNGIL